MLELAPLRWKPTSEQSDVKALLDANPYRAATLLDVVNTAGN